MKTITTSKLNIGDTFVMEVTDVNQGKYGPVYVAKVDGTDTEIRPSGNLKFLVDDLSSGKKKMHTPYRVTRVEDYQGFSKTANKAYVSSQFTIEPVVENQTAPTTIQPVSKEANIQEKLKAIRANRAQAVVASKG